jgi:hypothetical protein
MKNLHHRDDELTTHAYYVRGPIGERGLSGSPLLLKHEAAALSVGRVK